MKKQLLVLALVPMLGFSQHRSESDAITVVQKFWDGKVNRSQLKAVSQSGMARAKANENTDIGTIEYSCYDVNDPVNSRFVIVLAHLYSQDSFKEVSTYNEIPRPLC